ncbi:MAG: T9SS type A sorting domain-containing protein [Bacteroidota bacterium]
MEKTTTKLKFEFSKLLLVVLFLGALISNLNAQVTVTITLNCNGNTGSLASGSVSSTGTINDGDMVTINSSANRGWAKFDLSFLPAGATINSATAFFTTFSSTLSGATNSVFGFTGDPSSMTGAALYANCGSGTVYNSSTWSANALQTKALNPAGISFLQANVGNANVNLGYVRGSTNTYNISGYPGRSANTQPQLQITYTIPAAVPSSATTLSASKILVSSATLKGGITVGSTLPTSVTFTGIVISTSANPSVGGIGVIDSSTIPLVNSGTISFDVTGLTLGTTYHYRAYVLDTIGTSANIAYGADSTFTTPTTAPVPTVQRNVATNVLANTATVGGTIISNGGIPILSSGVVYSTTNNPLQFGVGVVDSTTNPVVTSGSFSVNPAGLTATTKYYYRAYATNSTGIAYSALDSFTTAPVVSTFPYTQNFDGAGNTGWNSVIVVGSFNNWAVGTPTKATISAAFSAPNCWTTGLSTQYVDNHDAALVSPQLDLTAFTSNAVLKFKHRFITESCCDGGFLEISIGGGAWTKVENVIGTGGNFNTTNGTAWYNLTTQGNSWADNSNAYSTQAGGWITSLIQLPGTSGQSNVRLRFRFVTDVSAVADGWAIDDIEVFSPAAPTVVTGTKSGITTNFATIGGNITNNGGAGITASGVVFSTTPTPTLGGFGVVDSATSPLATSGSFTVNLTGLTNSTTYYYRAYATNPVGTSYGADSTFTTNSSAVAPTILKIAATNVSDSGANIGGNITLDGGAAVTSSGVVYSTTSNPLIGGLGVIDSTTNPLVTTGSFTFNIIGLTANTKYYYSAYAVNSAGTTYTIQDSFTTAPVVSTFPYTQNFDGAGNTGWNSVIVVGSFNNWAVGTPTKATISAAFSAPNCWTTGLSTQYVDNHDAALVSPQLDLTAFTSNAVLKFKHRFITESCCDGGFLEISIGGGAWTKVENVIGTGGNFNTTNGTAWYNLTTQGNSWADNSNAYSTQAGGWITSLIQLPGTSGQSNVRLRFRFVTDVSAVADGWAIDDIEVFSPAAPTVVTGTKSGITTNFATIGGNITNNGGAGITASGVVFSTTPTPTLGGFGVVDSATSPLATSGSFTVNLTGLTNSTTYYYRAYATNPVGTSYGADSTFTTNSSAVAPTILKIAATNVSDSGANIGGNITSDGGSPVTASGVVYATTSNPALLGSGVIDSTTSPLVTSGTFTVNPIGLASNTKYYFRAYASNAAGTGYSIQDSFTTAPIVSVFPYTENFDGSSSISTGWTTVATGGLNEWLVGTPAKTQLSGAYSGTKCWFTSAAANYSDNHDGAVVSPRFDFTSLTSDPVVRFRHNFVTETGWDAAVLEISINNGAWTKLDDNLGTGVNFNTLSSYSWYNSSSTAGPMTPSKWSQNSNLFSSNVSNWIQSATRLTGAAGQSNVKFRIRFASDGSGTDEGWAFDNVEVVNDLTPTIPTGTVTLTPNGTSVNVAFVPGNGQGRLVVARLTSTTAVAPYDTVLYTANAAFSSGDITGTGNYVVYNGTGSSVNVTGLTTVTGYSFDVYEYNGKYMHNKFAAASSNTTTTLPVKLVSFTANNVEGNVQLKWITANEINNKGFEVERSVDGKNFSSIGFIKGAGNTNKTTNYSKIDLGAFVATSSNVLYYRLKQVDFDGTPTYSNQVAVNENELVSNGVKIYPNPFNKTLTVDIASDINTNTTIAITDISGKVISTTLVPVSIGNNTTTLPNLDLLTAGIYFVKVSNGTKAEVFKVIKY